MSTEEKALLIGNAVLEYNAAVQDENLLRERARAIHGLYMRVGLWMESVLPELSSSQAHSEVNFSVSTSIPSMHEIQDLLEQIKKASNRVKQLSERKKSLGV